MSSVFLDTPNYNTSRVYPEEDSSQQQDFSQLQPTFLSTVARVAAMVFSRAISAALPSVLGGVLCGGVCGMYLGIVTQDLSWSYIPAGASVGALLGISMLCLTSLAVIASVSFSVLFNGADLDSIFAPSPGNYESL